MKFWLCLFFYFLYVSCMVNLNLYFSFVFVLVLVELIGVLFFDILVCEFIKVLFGKCRYFFFELDSYCLDI